MLTAEERDLQYRTQILPRLRLKRYREALNRPLPSASGSSGSVSAPPPMPSFDPNTDIATIVSNYDASVASSVTVATGVSLWEDQNASGNDLAQGTAGSQPTYNTAAQNGLNTITTDGFDDFLFRSTLTGGLLSQEITVIIACDWISNTSNDNLFDSADSGNRCSLYASGASGNMTLFSTANGVTGVNRSAGFKIYRTVFNGASSQLFVDSVQQGSDVSPGVNGMIGLTLGARWDAGNDANVEFGEVIIAGAMTGQEIIDTEAYLTTKWGI